MTDKEKLHQILSSLWKNDDSVGKVYYNQALQDVQTAIDLKEEPVSEGLEKAAKYYIPDESYHMIIESKEEGSGENVYDYVQMINMFKAGANWQKEQMMAKAVDGHVTFEFYGLDSKTYGTIAHDPICLDDLGLKDTDKVKVIVIKED